MQRTNQQPQLHVLRDGNVTAHSICVCATGQRRIEREEEKKRRIEREELKARKKVDIKRGHPGQQGQAQGTTINETLS